MYFIIINYNVLNIQVFNLDLQESSKKLLRDLNFYYCLILILLP